MEVGSDHHGHDFDHGYDPAASFHGDDPVLKLSEHIEAGNAQENESIDSDERTLRERIL